MSDTHKFYCSNDLTAEKLGFIKQGHEFLEVLFQAELRGVEPLGIYECALSVAALLTEIKLVSDFVTEHVMIRQLTRFNLHTSYM